MPRLLPVWRNTEAPVPSEWTLVRVDDADLSNTEFEQWLRGHASAEAPPHVLLLAPADADVSTLRELAAMSDVNVEFLLSAGFDTHAPARLKEELAKYGIFIEQVEEESALGAREEPADAPAAKPDLGPYLHPSYRLSDEGYAQWFERLRQNPKDRDD